MSTDIIIPATRAEWLARRRACIGGSDIAKIAGLSPYGGPFEVYLEKTGQVLEQQPNWHMRRGIALEPVILDIYAEREAVELEPLKSFTLFVDGIAGGTPDGLVVGAERGVEAKAPQYATGYGEPGTDEVPEHHLVQCIWYAGLTGRPSWDLAATVGGDVAIYHLTFNAELYAALREMAEKFWRDHVLRNVPPPVDGSESSRAWLRQQFPENRAPLLEPNEEALKLVAEYRAIKPYFDEQEKAVEGIKSRLMQLIGDADGIRGVATWKKQKDSRNTDYAAMVREMAALIDPAEYSEIHERNTATVPGVRRFLFTNSNGRK